MSDKGPPEDLSKEELWDQYLRAQADRENERKRHLKEVRAAREEGVTQALREVLPAVDELERATLAAEKIKGRGGLKQIREGLGHTRRSVQQTLKNIGVEAFDSVGQDFDPNRMEALSRVPDPTLEPGKVAGELERGYTHQGKLLRPARVAVSIKPDEEAS